MSRQMLRDIAPMELSPATAPTTLPAVASTAPSTQPVGIGLDEARALALQNNLDLKIALLDPTISRQSISEAESRFEALFTTNARYASNRAPVISRITSGTKYENFNVNPGVELPLRTGGTLTVDAPMGRTLTSNENNIDLLNPSWSATPAVTLAHPLLRGAGLEVNEAPIRIASLSYLQSEARTKLEIIRVLADVDRFYWRLYAARQYLLVRKQEYDLAVAQLERARNQVRAGMASEVEVVRAESGVADSREAIITAENNVRDRERDLKRIMNEPGMDVSSPTIVVPTAPLRTLYYRVEPEQLIQQAMSQRMELINLELQILAETTSVAVARNGMLPLVSMQYTYGVSGIGGTFGEAWSMVDDNDFDSYAIGLRLEIPIGNEAARSALRRALASRQQTLATQQQRILQIKQEILAAVDQLNTNWYRIIAARKRVELAERLLNAEIRQFSEGLRTSTDVINAQASLASAQTAELAALVDYQISQVDIAFATGTTLGQAKVSWQPTTAPTK